MAIDMHTHFSTQFSQLDNIVTKDILAMFERQKIDRALVMPLAGIFSNCIDHEEDNNKVISFCQKAPKNLFPAFTVNPLMNKKALKEIHRCRKELNIKVLKLHPWTQGFSVSSPEMKEVAKLCEKLDITVIFHDGTPPYSTPFQIASLARDFPDLSVVAGHAGLYDFWENAIQAAQRYKNYYLCLCTPSMRAMQKIVDEVPADQLCMGSDIFIELPSNLLANKLRDNLLWYRWEKYRKLKIPEDKRKIIEDETPKKLLGL